MVAPLELVCVRHGTTALNTARIFQGQGNDPALSPIGEAQVSHLAAHLRSEHFDFAVSSDLVRAAQTAAGLCPGVVFDRDWREFDFGAWEGLTWEQIRARYSEQAAAFARNVREVEPPGGETFEDVVVRVKRALARIVDALPQGGRALIVTHTGPLHALRHVLLRNAADDFRAHFSPAGVTRYRVEGERVDLLCLDDHSHLPEDIDDSLAR